MGEGCDECKGGWRDREDTLPQYYELFQAYAWFKNYGLLPVAGTWLQQASFFIHMVEFCDMAAASWRNKLKEQRERNDNFVNRIKGDGRRY